MGDAWYKPEAEEQWIVQCSPFELEQRWAQLVSFIFHYLCMMKVHTPRVRGIRLYVRKRTMLSCSAKAWVELLLLSTKALELKRICKADKFSDYTFTNIQYTREHLQKLVSLLEHEHLWGDEASTSKHWTKLHCDIIQWRTYTFDHYSVLCDHILISDSTKPKDDHLQLPSAFTTTQQTNPALTDLTAIEYDLREGQAHDTLHAVCKAIKTFNYNLTYKKTNIHGNRATLKSNH